MKLSYKKTIFVGFAFFLICAFWQAYDNIIPKILTDKFGLSQSVSGLVMGLDNVLALFLLPLFGAISDHSHFKSGRRTPFIRVGTIIAIVFFLILSAADYLQLRQLKDVEISNPTALETLYEADLSITTPGGSKVEIQEKFTKAEFTAIEFASEDYTNYVTPARQAYARTVTQAKPQTLYFFMAVLLVLLISMAVFRSPAVALMPDITLKPLRSKGNAVINLMGAAGGILVLVLGIVFRTGQAKNALMSYFPFFLIVALIMALALIFFLAKVDEPKWVQEMEEQTAEFGLTEEEEDTKEKKKGKLTRGQRRSLLLLLLSVALWYMGYNAVTSKYSVYAGSVLNLDYNLTLIIAQAAAIVSYIPVGMIASKVGRKKCIIAGVILLGAAFAAAAFMGPGSSMTVMTVFFAIAGIGWATINVNSFPMVVELASGGNVGRYTGFYYTASMLAQTVTPYFSGLLMDKMGMRTLFPYGAVFVLLAIASMWGVQHGDSRPDAPQSALEAFDVED